MSGGRLRGQMLSADPQPGPASAHPPFRQSSPRQHSPLWQDDPTGLHGAHHWPTQNRPGQQRSGSSLQLKFSREHSTHVRKLIDASQTSLPQHSLVAVHRPCRTVQQWPPPQIFTAGQVVAQLPQ